MAFSLAAATNLLQSIAWGNTAVSPSVGVRTIVFTATDDEDAESADSTLTLDIYNNAPVVDLNGAGGGINASGTFTEGDSYTSYLTAATLTDADSDPLVSLVMTAGGGWGDDGPDELIKFDTWVTDADTDLTDTLVVGSTTFSLAFVSATGVLTITKSGGGTFPAADGQALQRLFQYVNSAEPPTEGDRTFSWVASDGTDSSTAAVLTVTVSAAVVAPVVQADPSLIVANGAAINYTPTATAGTGITWTAENLPTGASINSSTGQVTGTLSTNGQYHMKITATNLEGADSIYVPVMVYATLTTIDASWLSTNGPAPYLLTGDNTVFQLDANVTENEEAFVFQGNNQALDVAGNTLTYNNASANTIANQDLDTFTGSDPDDWTVTGDSSHTSVAKSSSYVFPRWLCEGTNALRVTIAQVASNAGTLTAGTPANIASTGHGLSTGDAVILDGFTATTYGASHASYIRGGYIVTVVDPDNFTINADVSAVSDGAGTWKKATRIRSSSTALPVNNRLYAATAFVSNDPGSGAAYDCSIKLVDTSTGLELEKSSTSEDQIAFYDHTYTGNGFRNFSPAVTCKSATTANVYVDIYLASTSSGVVVDVCRARLSQAYDHAAIARGNSSTQFPERFNYDTTSWSGSANLGPHAIIDTVGGGSVVQGQNKGYRSWPAMIRKSAGAMLHGCGITMTGDDPSLVYDQAVIGNPSTARDLLIAHVAIAIGNVVNVVRRDSQTYVIAGRQWLGNVITHKNTIDDSPSMAINCSTDNAATYQSIVDGNSITPKTVVTNSYAIFAQSNSVIQNNTVDSTGSGKSGRGLLINGGQNVTIDGVVLRNNVFRCKESRHRESSANSYTRAFRMRNMENGDSTNGTLLNIVSSGNVFHCECTEADYLYNVQGARWSIRDNSNGMDTTEISSTDDTFSAINAFGTGLAQAIEIGRKDGAVADLTIDNPTFISNHRCLKLHGNDDTVRTLDGIYVDGATFEKDATAGAPSTFVTFEFGYNASSVTQNTEFTNNTFGTGTAYDDVSEVGTHTVTIDP